MSTTHEGRDADLRPIEEGPCGDVERLRSENDSLSAALREVEDRFALFMDASPDACLLLDGELRYIYFNRTAEWLTGEKLEQAKGTPIPIARPGSDPGGRLDLYKGVMRNGEPLTIDDVAPGGALGARRFRVRAFKAGDGLGLIWTDITEYKRVEEELTNVQRELRALTAHLVEVREDERKGLARELHDELGQTLTAIEMELRWMARNHAQLSPEGDRESVGRLIVETTQAIRQVQRMSSDLRPSILDNLGLSAAIEWLADDYSRRKALRVEARVAIDDRAIGDRAATALFRIAQEALTNVVRHARASSASLSLRGGRGSIVLEVNDDGVGITEEQASSPSAFGILGMRERAKGLGGKAAISAKAGGGTRLVVSIPERPEPPSP